MQKKQEDYGLELQKSFDRWTHIYEYGGSDPTWEDGFNLNIVRNHIIYYRSKIEETMAAADYPAIYFKEIPSEVYKEYMAQPDKIREAAKASLAKYMDDPNYQYLLQHKHDFSLKTQETLSIDNVIGYATGLEIAIENDNLVVMRRHENCESYLKAFEGCVLRMQEIPSEIAQLSLFSLLSDEGYGKTKIKV